MAKARGEVLMCDRGSLNMAAKAKGEPENLRETAWRGFIWEDGHQLWHGKAHWTRSAAWDEMFMANEANGWGAVLKAPLPDEAPAL